MGDFEHILDQIYADRTAYNTAPSPVSDDYKKGWYDGYQAAQRQNSTITHPIIPTKLTVAGSDYTPMGGAGANGGTEIKS